VAILLLKQKGVRREREDGLLGERGPNISRMKNRHKHQGWSEAGKLRSNMLMGDVKKSRNNPVYDNVWRKACWRSGSLWVGGENRMATRVGWTECLEMES
jgi:hypothetical protein